MTRLVSRLALLCLTLTLMAAAPSGAATNPPDVKPAASGLPLYLFLYRPGPAWKADRPMTEQGLGPHFRYLKGLLEQGRLFGAGPLLDNDGGLAIVRAANLEDARAMLAADPAIASRIFEADVHVWDPRLGGADPLPVRR